MAAVTGVLALAQIGYGLYKGYKANQIDTTIPKFEIPEERLRANRLLERRATLGLGLPYQSYTNFLARQGAEQVSALRSVGRLTPNSIGAIGRQTADNARQFGITAAKEKINAEYRFAADLNSLSELRAEQFKVNELAPALRRLKKAEQLQKEGDESIQAGIGSIVGSFAGSDPTSGLPQSGGVSAGSISGGAGTVSGGNDFSTLSSAGGAVGGQQVAPSQGFNNFDTINSANPVTNQGATLATQNFYSTQAFGNTNAILGSDPNTLAYLLQPTG